MFKELHPHLVELRKRLAISVASLVGMFFVMFFFHEPLLNWMVEPLNMALLEVGKKSVHAADGMVTTSQVGDSAMYLLSDLSSGVTGEVHYVDSGYNIMGMAAAQTDEDGKTVLCWDNR